MSGKWIEFKPLFLVLLAKMREANDAHGGEEMLRLRAYEALQEMVLRGQAEREGKAYRGIPKAIAEATAATAAMAAEQSRSPVRALTVTSPAPVAEEPAR